MNDGQMTRNDPWSYLSGTGVTGGGSKKADVKVRGHNRSMPASKGSTGALAPDHQPNPAMKSAASHMANPETKAGEATMVSRGKATQKPESLNIEGNESAKYEKLEKRSLRGLKGGGTEKELRDGHNERDGMGKAKIEKTMHEYKEGGLHSGSKKGPKVTNRKQAIAIAMSQARKAGAKV
jgi:hypothetical protein